MKKIDSKDFIKIMREEYNRTLEKLAKLDDEDDSSEEVQIDLSSLNNLLSVGLSIKHIKSGINYEIVKVGDEKSVIESPDGKKYLIPNSTLDKNFAIN